MNLAIGIAPPGRTFHLFLSKDQDQPKSLDAHQFNSLVSGVISWPYQAIYLFGLSMQDKTKSTTRDLPRQSCSLYIWMTIRNIPLAKESAQSLPKTVRTVVVGRFPYKRVTFRLRTSTRQDTWKRRHFSSRYTRSRIALDANARCVTAG